MFGFKRRNEQQYREGLTDTGQRWQVRFAMNLVQPMTRIISEVGLKVDPEFICAAISNWVFRFGDYGPWVAAHPDMKAGVDACLARTSEAMTNDDAKVEITAAFIICAAAQKIPTKKYRAHFEKVADLGIIMRGINIFGLEDELRGDHRVYYYYMQYGKQLFGDH